MLDNRLRHADFVVAKNTSAHKAILELTGNRVAGIEQALHAFDKTSVSCWVDGGVTVAHWSGIFIQLLLGLKKNQRS